MNEEQAWSHAEQLMVGFVVLLIWCIVFFGICLEGINYGDMKEKRKPEKER
jgi:hypothetical protein